MKVRPGVTLLEVLIAIFIMGIGLLALLTLFPLGATTMTQAMRDARCAEAGANAKSICFALNIAHDARVTKWFPIKKPASTVNDPDWDGPSYPVYVDPIGQHYITGMPALVAPSFHRADYSRAQTPSGALHWCSLQDDYQFDTNGSANIPGTGVERESRYTWAYLMKQPNVKNPTIVDISVVCYVGRNLQVPGGESYYDKVDYVDGSRTFILSYPADKPNLKRGGWIMDVTSHTFDDPKNTADRDMALKYGPVHGLFYRVVDFTEVNTNQIEVELQTVPVAPLYKRSGTLKSFVQLPGSIVILDNVAEVFPIGPGWKQ